MKMKFSAILIVIFAICICSQSAFAITTSKVKVDGILVSFEVAPKTANNTTMISVKPLFSKLGVKYVYNSKTQTVTGTKNNVTISFQVNKIYATQNNKKVKLVAIPISVKGIIMAPINFIVESFGGKITWDSKSSTYLVTTKATKDIGNQYTDLLKKNISEVTVPTVTMSNASYNTLVKNGDLFFTKTRKLNSLSNIATDTSIKDIIKNISKYNSTIISLSRITISSINETNIGNGNILTTAIAYTGGEVSTITGVYEEQIFIQIFLVGSSELKKGDVGVMKGVPIGTEEVLVTDSIGKQTTQPMYVFAAGNLYGIIRDTLKNYDINKSITELILDAGSQKSLDEMIWDDKETNQKKQDELNQALINAVKTNSIEKVKSYLKQGADPNTFCTDSESIVGTSLTFAISKGYDDLVKVLKDSGANPSDTYDALLGFLYTQYKRAIPKNYIDVLFGLLKAGALPNEKSVLATINAEEYSLVKEYLNLKVKFTSGDLYFAVRTNEPSMEIISSILATGVQGDTSSLNWAILRNDIDMINVLIKAGAKVNSESLSQVVDTKNIEIIKEFMQIDEFKSIIKSSPTSSESKRVLQILVESGDVKFSKQLMFELGIRPNSDTYSIIIEKWNDEDNKLVLDFMMNTK